MFTFLKKLVGGRSVARASKPLTRQAKPQLEALDQRLVLSTVPNLQGVTLHLDGPVVGSRQLHILSETDFGNGTGTFQGLCQNTYGVAFVSGTISLKHAGNGSVGNPSDFGLTYFGGGPGYYGGADLVQGSGDFRCSQVSSIPGDYPEYTRGTPSWNYSGSDVEWTLGGFFNVAVQHHDTDWQSAILW
jgi:hypothetical protein